MFHIKAYNLIHADTTGKLVRHKRFPIAERASIHSCPDLADGKCFGDFEMDLIVDSHNHTILSIVERSTNMLFITKLTWGKNTEPLAKLIRRLLLPYKRTSRPSPLTTAPNLRTKAHYKVFRSRRLSRRFLCLMAERSD